MKRNRAAAFLAAAAVFLGGCGGSGTDVCGEASGTVFENVKVIDAVEMLGFEQGEGNTTLNLLLAPGAQEVDRDDVLVFGTSDRLPHGMLRKAADVTENGDGTVTVATTEAGLGDVFEELNLCREGRLDPSELNGTDTPLSAYTGEHALFDFSYAIDEDFGQEMLHLEGNTDFSVGYRIEIRTRTVCGWTDGCHVTVNDGTTFILDAKADTGVTLWAGKADAWQKSEVLFSKDFSPFTVVVAGVPVVFVPELEIIGGVEGSAEAELTTNAQASAEGYVGIKRRSGAWETAEGLNHSFGYSPPALYASAAVKAYAGPKVKLKIYDVTGPYADLYGFAEMKADTRAEPWWLLYAGLESHGGFRMQVLHHTLVSVHKLIYFKKIDVADAGGAF